MQEFERLPDTDAIATISDALGEAVIAEGTPGGVVMMVVQPNEKNSFDQQV